jgi:hypothetical protein
MPSSRPSRRLSSSSVSTTTKYNSNPRWRSPYIKDARAKTTLSLVFAEPEVPKSISSGTAEKHIASMHDALSSKCVRCVYCCCSLSDRYPDRTSNRHGVGTSHTRDAQGIAAWLHLKETYTKGYTSTRAGNPGDRRTTEHLPRSRVDTSTNHKPNRER